MIGLLPQDGQNGLKRIRIATIAALANEIKRQQGPRRRSGFKHPLGKNFSFELNVLFRDLKAQESVN